MFPFLEQLKGKIETGDHEGAGADAFFLLTKYRAIRCCFEHPEIVDDTGLADEVQEITIQETVQNRSGACDSAASRIGNGLSAVPGWAPIAELRGLTDLRPLIAVRVVIGLVRLESGIAIGWLLPELVLPVCLLSPLILRDLFLSRHLPVVLGYLGVVLPHPLVVVLELLRICVIMLI